MSVLVFHRGKLGKLPTCTDTQSHPTTRLHTENHTLSLSHTPPQSATIPRPASTLVYYNCFGHQDVTSGREASRKELEEKVRGQGERRMVAEDLFRLLVKENLTRS